jgi:hypothetical protein
LFLKEKRQFVVENRRKSPKMVITALLFYKKNANFSQKTGEHDRK